MKNIKSFVKAYWKTLLFFTVIGLVGGFFTGIYLLDSYPADIRQQLLAEVSAAGLDEIPADLLMGLLTAVQSAGYGLILGGIGIWLSRKVGLWKDETHITKKPLLLSIAVSVVGGLSMILLDILFFGKYSEAIMTSYAVKPSIPYILASITYGAVIEEVMLRLFMMSLAVFILHMLFGRKNPTPSAAVLIAANVITALLFAAGHLPATFMLLGNSPLIILRCFLLNGGLGLLFGYLYRKHGLRYAMIAHGGCHVVSKLIWMLLI